MKSSIPTLVNATATNGRRITCFVDPKESVAVRFYADGNRYDFTARTQGRALRKARRAAGKLPAAILA